MCLTIPGKILGINKNIATVKSTAGTSQIDLGLVSGAKVGSWLLYATDRAVKVISEHDAEEIIDLLEAHYRKIDVDKLSSKFKETILRLRTRAEIPKSKYQISNLAYRQAGEIQNQKYKKTEAELKADIEFLLGVEDKDELETLFAEANSLRKERLEDFVCIHGIIEFSNYCKNNCLYCGIRNDCKIARYRMTEAEIVEVAAEAVNKEGYKLLVLQSGEDNFYKDEDLIQIIKKIKKTMKVFIFISVGERSEQFYRQAYKAGATGSLMRFETSNPKLYKKMRPEHSLEQRLKSLELQKKLGYYVASGSLVGLPGQTISDIAADILMVKELGLPMLSSGPFIQAAGTPLAENPNSKFQIPNEYQNPNVQAESQKESFPILSTKNPKGAPVEGGYQLKTQDQLQLILKYMAICRLVMPEIKIPVTTALETLDKKAGRHKGLLAGANALMFNLTPEKYCKKYSIYDNKFRDREKIWQKYGLFQGEESWEMLEAKLRL